MNIAEFNALNREDAEAVLATCCGSSKWQSLMMEQFPFSNAVALIEAAEKAWYDTCTPMDWIEAFSHHPRIGDTSELAKKFATTHHLAGNEQSGVKSASSDILNELLEANIAYEKKFAYIFIVCATGKTADEMLRLLNARLSHTGQEEIAIAMGEQHKITILRLKKLLADEDWSFLKVSQLTTHVLDTSIGKPGKDIAIRLKAFVNNNWRTIAMGITNADGRIPDLLPPSRILSAGNYKMVFDTAGYFASQQLTGFYPEVDIQFTMPDDQHYHVPLLINPYGYSTYRGS